MIGDEFTELAYVHVGHDCVVGDHVIMANNASLAGHVTVGDYANFGGYSGIPQFRAVGAYTHIAAMSLVLKDVPAYMTVTGNPAYAAGLNIEGMKRRGYSKETIKAVRDAYKTIYRQGLTTADGLRTKRKWAIVLTFIVAAFLTPPDPVSQLGLAIPTLLLYELSIFAVGMVEKKRAAEQAARDAELG